MYTLQYDVPPIHLLNVVMAICLLPASAAVRTRGWGYDSGVGRLSESPMVAVVVLGTYVYTVINSISTQFSRP